MKGSQHYAIMKMLREMLLNVDEDKIRSLAKSIGELILSKDNYTYSEVLLSQLLSLYLTIKIIAEEIVKEGAAKKFIFDAILQSCMLYIHAIDEIMGDSLEETTGDS